MQILKKKPSQTDFIRLAEAGQFDPRSPAHRQALQALIDSGDIWSMPPRWQRFAQTCCGVNIVKSENPIQAYRRPLEVRMIIS